MAPVPIVEVELSPLTVTGIDLAQGQDLGFMVLGTLRLGKRKTNPV